MTRTVNVEPAASTKKYAARATLSDLASSRIGPTLAMLIKQDSTPGVQAACFSLSYISLCRQPGPGCLNIFVPKPVVCDFRAYSSIWPWVKIQIVPPVNIPIATKIGFKMGGEFIYQPKWDTKTVLTTATSKLATAAAERSWPLQRESTWIKSLLPCLHSIRVPVVIFFG